MISEIIEKWIKGILIDGITGNLSGLFDNVNAKVGEIASDVGSTPQAWNSGIFNMLRSLSETVVLPIAAAILALKWAPSQGAWQRQLNQNAIRAAARIDFLRPEDGTSPYQLQPFVKRENKEMSR